MTYKEMGLAEMSKLPGITDLPSTAKVPFIKALKLEEEGKTEEAKAMLDKAIEAEEASKSKK